MEEEIKIISQTIIEFQDSGRTSNDALARIIIGNLEKNGYKLKKLNQHDVSDLLSAFFDYLSELPMGLNHYESEEIVKDFESTL